MILKLVDENKCTIGAVKVYENDENGEVCVQDTYHINAITDGFDSVFGTNDEEVIVIIDIAKFKENCLIAGEVYQEFKDCNDEDFYRECMFSICNKLNVVSGPIPNRAYEIWSIIEEEYL